MIHASNVRLSIPEAAAGEITREELVSTILNNKKKITYIHAGAGYGKTTLLSQVANSMDSTAWVTLDGESNIFAFLNIFCESLRQVIPGFDFNVSEYLPFSEKSNFIATLAESLISSIEKLSKEFMIIVDDLHTAEEQQIKKLITYIVKYKPQKMQLCLGSREAPWQELVSLCIRGDLLEITQKELAFTRDETIKILGFYDEYIYNLTEGWPMAVCSFKVLFENNVSASEAPSSGKEALYSYLFYECMERLPSELAWFLKVSACFVELDPQMLNTVLNIKNAKLLLDSLVARNIFTLRTNSGYYRYHTLFRDYLLECTEDSLAFSLQCKAAKYYFDGKQYTNAAEYAIRLKDNKILEQVILVSYREYIRHGSFSKLQEWFNALGDEVLLLNRELLVAKGAFLSTIGNFTAANTYLDKAIPLLCEGDRELYIEAMVHKARVLRNFISFEESNKLLDQLIAKLDDPASEISYTVGIEKLYNLCWNSQINEAYTLAYQMINTCAKAGNAKVRAWYERYLSVVHFLAGRMKDAVSYYEKSLELPENERQYLDMHSIGIYTAKAYQMLGERDKAVSMISMELQRLRSEGRYEELWLGYLFAAEIHHQNTCIDRLNGGMQTFEETKKYFTLADEYAPLYRKTEFQMKWAKMQRYIYSLMFISSPKESIVNKIYANLDHISDYFKTIALARLFNYLDTTSDYLSVVVCAKQAIEIGERGNMMLIPTAAYGILARYGIGMKDREAVALTKRFLQLCSENGIYEYFRMRKAYDPVLDFALHNGIEPDFVKQMMEFAGYKIKKAYISTLGSFSVFPYDGRQKSLKMRTKKERELLAFLLDAGSEGVTKEQIYEALWYESKSDDIKKLIGVNLAHIKNDLARLGVEKSIENHEKHYSICREEIVADIDLFEESAEEFRLQGSTAATQKILSLYKGEYLSDFEAHWAVSKRIRYDEIFKKALTSAGTNHRQPE